MAKDAQPVDVHIFTANYGGRQGVSFKFNFPILTHLKKWPFSSPEKIEAISYQACMAKHSAI